MAGDEAGDDDGGTRSLSYAELGAARRISTASAKRLAIRRHWPKMLGNDGTARVLVPVAELVPADDAAGDDTPDAPLLAEALAEVRTLREALAEEQVARAQAEGELRGVREALAEAQRRAEAAEQGVGAKLAGMAKELRWLQMFGKK